MFVSLGLEGKDGESVESGYEEVTLILNRTPNGDSLIDRGRR